MKPEDRGVVMEATVAFGPGHAVFLVLALSTLFFMLVWTVGVVVRLHVPENAVSTPSRPAQRYAMARGGQQVLVGIREIREDERYWMGDRAPVEYEYSGLPSHQLPTAWLRDLDQRRN